MKTHLKSFPDPRARSLAGFTLVEMLVAMACAMILMGAVFGGYLTGWKGFIEMGHTQQAHADTRHVVEMFSREARQASAITSYSSSDITLRIPLTFRSNGTVNTSKLVRYYRNGCMLTRVDNGVPTNLIDTTNCNIHSVSSLVFTMYDTAGAATASTSQANSLQMDLSLDYSNQDPPRTDRSSVRVKIRLI